MMSARELIPAVNFLFTFPPYRYLATKRLVAIYFTAEYGGIYAPESRII
jgi:hypothetical protein